MLTLCGLRSCSARVLHVQCPAWSSTARAAIWLIRRSESMCSRTAAENLIARSIRSAMSSSTSEGRASNRLLTPIAGWITTMLPSMCTSTRLAVSRWSRTIASAVTLGSVPEVVFSTANDPVSASPSRWRPSAASLRRLGVRTARAGPQATDRTNAGLPPKECSGSSSPARACSASVSSGAASCRERNSYKARSTLSLSSSASWNEAV